MAAVTDQAKNPVTALTIRTDWSGQQRRTDREKRDRRVAAAKAESQWIARSWCRIP